MTTTVAMTIAASALFSVSCFAASASANPEAVTITLKKVTVTMDAQFTIRKLSDTVEICDLDGRPSGWGQLWQKIEEEYPDDVRLKLGKMNVNGAKMSLENCPESGIGSIDVILVSKADHAAAQKLGYFQ